MYKELAGNADLPIIFTKRARADIVILEKNKERGAVPKFVVEIKRRSAPTKDIDNDLQRLSAIARIDQNLRVMIFVISEAKRSDRFVTKDGVSIKGSHPLPDKSGRFRVRRTYKAAHKFAQKDQAHYASLLEVYPNRRAKLKTREKTGAVPTNSGQ